MYPFLERAGKQYLNSEIMYFLLMILIIGFVNAMAGESAKAE